ncbi:hypothetical protein PHAVU_003G237700 [Phaseolus vulgaris]|uniref:Uncharacterized protein n=1 Tax=Phaseolus vulgaris TaxID=3885 RepID=V7CCD4_PHAVU|nr:hypothetical protein PHAVU_003G237700g [Phaseolus vulgaris]ESW27852.1 hypothetical protein PHAVU_003G237700g [Phaseolus vulgaris]
MGRRCRQPVIPPLPRAGGYRCSVKPTSHITFQSKIKEIQAFPQIPLINSWFGVFRMSRIFKHILGENHIKL